MAFFDSDRLYVDHKVLFARGWTRSLVAQNRLLLCISVLLAAIALATSLPAGAVVGVERAVVKVAWRALIRHPSVLPDEEIFVLANRAKQAGGTKLIGQELARRNLPAQVLDDAYMRIVVCQARIDRKEAERLIFLLRGTPGLRSTLSKIAGANGAKTAGHLNELRIAGAGAREGFAVRGIGVQFNDQLKRAPTDIDLLMGLRGRTLAVEAKDYLPDTPIPLDVFRADMDSLAQYRKLYPGERVIPVFTVTNRPKDTAVVRLLEQAAEQRGVELVFGDPGEQVYLMRMLVDVYAKARG